jgi:hypothetical protein
MKPIDQEIASARAELDAVSAKLRALEERAKQPTPWEPKGGDWVTRVAFNEAGRAGERMSFSHRHIAEAAYTKAGYRWPTREAAESALPYLAFFQRLVALAQDVNPSGKVGGQFYIYCGGETCSPWEPTVWSGPKRGCQCLFETREAAQKAAGIMNRDGWKIPAL